VSSLVSIQSISALIVVNRISFSSHKVLKYEKLIWDKWMKIVDNQFRKVSIYKNHFCVSLFKLLLSVDLSVISRRLYETTYFSDLYHLFRWSCNDGQKEVPERSATKKCHIILIAVNVSDGPNGGVLALAIQWI